MIGENLNTIAALKQHIEEAQYLLKVAVETAKKIRAYDKNLYPYMIKQVFKNDKKLACHRQTFYDLVMDVVLNN